MKNRVMLAATLMVAVFVSGTATSQEPSDMSSQKLTGFEAFAQEPAMVSAQLSPNGEHLATIQRLTKDGKPVLYIYEVDDLDGDPVTLGSDRMEIVSAVWANNERLVVRFRQDVGALEALGANTRLASKLATIDREGKRWLEIPRDRSDRRSDFSQLMQNYSTAQVIDLLPKERKHILIQYDDDGNGVADFYRVNVETGAGQRVARNSSKISIGLINEDMEPRLASSYDEGSGAQIYLARLAGSSNWQEVGRTEANLENNSLIFNALDLVGGPDSNEIWVLSNHETDTSAIYTFDLESREFSDIQFMHPKYDATGLATYIDEKGEEQVAGFRYSGRAGDVYWVDPQQQALQNAIDQVLPNLDNAIVSRSRDQKTMVIRSEGPRKPATYYLLDEGRITLLGESMPFLTEDMLAEAEWTSYTARDGLEIPSIVTIPNGEGPFPIVVLPHGGPVARDYWGFDLWSQLLAYHGYVVIQPQFRISSGFGREHLEAGYARWGYEMQDDLEDAIKYLDKRGLGDPERAAIFGWSYGGYAAFVGSFRDPNPFHCAIAGAGVADIPYFRAWLADFGTATEKTYRKTVDGINPLNHVDSVDVPILVIHGDIDERVPVDESRKFVRELEKHNKFHKYIELEGANHFFGTIFYRHWMEMFPEMIDWLDNTCELKE